MFADRSRIDINVVIDDANSQPFSHIHRPGTGVGGHCIPMYPRFYLAGDPEARIPLVSRAINDAMPSYAVDLLERELERPLAGTHVLILGVSYRGEVKEAAFSSAFGVRRELERSGAQPLAADPLYDGDELRAHGFEPWDGRGTPPSATAAAVRRHSPSRRTPGKRFGTGRYLGRAP